MIRTTPIPDTKRESAYNDVKAMLVERASNIANKWNATHDIDDFISVGHEAFVIAFKDYDRDRNTKFSTWFWNVCTCMMLDYARRTYTRDIDEQCAAHTVHAHSYVNVERRARLHEAIEQLPYEVETVVYCALQFHDRHTDKRNKRISPATLFKHMRDEGANMRKDHFYRASVCVCNMLRAL